MCDQRVNRLTLRSARHAVPTQGGQSGRRAVVSRGQRRAGWTVLARGRPFAAASRADRSGDAGVHRRHGKWTPLGQVPELAGAAASSFGAPPPPPPGGQRAHEIDFQIFGEDLQFVEVELDPRESVVAEAGAMMYMTPGHRDGDRVRRRQRSAEAGGFMGKLLGAGKRLLTGESLFMTVFTNTARSGVAARRVRRAVSRPHPGDGPQAARRRADLPEGLVPLRRQGRLGRHRLPAKIGAACSAAKASSCSGCRATASAFVHAGGMLHTIDLAPGETLRVDTGCLVAMQPQVNYDIQFVGKVKTALFGGEGLFFATLTGPGPRLAAVAAAQPPRRSHPPRRCRASPADAGRGRRARRLGGSATSSTATRCNPRFADVIVTR